MATKKPFSTISFNTLDFLKLVCEELMNESMIQSYYFIKHYAEQDTKKDHFHLLLVPARPLDPVKVRKNFVEPCSQGDLICLPFQPSKITDWLLYSIHYPPYLIRKGLTRVCHYNLQDIVSNESFECLEDIFYRGSEDLTNKRMSSFLDRVYNGDSFGEILASGLVPENQVIFYDKLYHQFSCRNNPTSVYKDDHNKIKKVFQEEFPNKIKKL